MQIQVETVQIIVAILNLIIAFLTLGVISWYTWVTHKMQKEVSRQAKIAAEQAHIAAQQAAELVHQTKLSIMPAFTIEVGSSDRGLILKLCNIGNGVANSIEIDQIDVQIESSKKNLIFNNISSLRPSEERVVNYKYSDINDDSNISSFPDNQLDISRSVDVVPFLLNNKRDLRIKFQDLEGNIYSQKVQMDKHGCRPSPVEPVESADIPIKELVGKRLLLK